MDTDVYTQVKASIKRTLNINLENYKDEQMKRRLDSWLVRAHIDNWKDYFNMLSADTKETERFRNYLTINVTEFFRDPSRWDLLQRDVLPYLIKNSAGNHELKLWSAGCSIGTEAYTMAIYVLRTQSNLLNNNLVTFTILTKRSNNRYSKKWLNQKKESLIIITSKNTGNFSGQTQMSLYFLIPAGWILFVLRGDGMW